MSSLYRAGVVAALVAAVVGCALEGEDLPASARATSQPVASVVYADEAGVAIGGYDTVAYHTRGQATQGDPRYAYEWNGATWRFVSSTHRDLFQSNPQRYAPAYGGYCAWGVAAKEDLFPGDGTQWEIVGGRLFLNFNPDVKKTWTADRDAFIDSADEKWESVAADKGGES